MDMNKNRFDKPVQTPPLGTEVAIPDCVTIEQRMKTTAAEVCWNLADQAEPSRCQETAVVAEGDGTGGTTNERDRSIDCNKSTTVRTLPTNCDRFMEPLSGRGSPVVTDTASTDGTGVMQYQWDDRDSVETTEMLMPRNYLEIPVPTLPRVFLNLAEEASNVILEKGRSYYTEEVQPQGTGLTRPVFVTVMVDGPPVLKKRALRAAGLTRFEYRREGKRSRGPDVILAGRGETVDRPGLVGPQNRTEQSVFLRLDADQVGHVPASTVDPDVMITEISQ